MKILSKNLPALLPLAFLSFSSPFLGAQEEAPTAALSAPSAVVVTVDGTPITEGDVREIITARFGQQLQQMPQEQIGMVLQQMQQMVLGDLISKTLFLNAAQKEGYEASTEAVDEQLDEIASRLPEGANLEEYAAENGVDLNRIKNQIIEDVKIRQLFDEVTGDITKPDAAEVKSYYDEHPDEFSQDPSVEASHILIATRGIEDEAELAAKKKQAEEVKALLTESKGENFAELAGTHSDCPSKAEGGSLGEFSRGQMVPEFEEAAFKQEVGVVGDMVETQFGYHFIKVTERTDAKKLSFEEVEEELADNLFEKKKGEKIEAYLEELRAAAKIEQPDAPAAEAPAAPGLPGEPLLPPSPASEDDGPSSL